ncbi:MAG: AAA family ATPase [Flavobacteriales bacterium]|nr:AAA family ATPase [Flavobacteriales bacterium]
MRIFLIGYMGCGKSTVAKKLANKLGLKVVDLDAEIVNATGKSIPEIFMSKGESGFRQLEKSMLQKWFKTDGFVMATGGGTPCFFESMDEMSGVGTTIYLQMTAKALVDRLSESKEERPILKGLSKEKMLKKVSGQLAKREKFYKKAMLTVNGVNLDIEELIGSLDHSK